jgi:predicted deacylase
MPADPGYSVKRIPVSVLGNGHELAVGVHEVVGDRPGPTIGISGGLHGDEPDTVEFLRCFIERMRQLSFSGTIIALPCANPLAYESRTRNTPTDMMDLNRVFPGDIDGTLTQQLAATIYAVFAQRCDYFVDLHCGGLFPAVEYAYVHGDAALARSAGLKLVYTGPSYNGSLALCLEQTGMKTTVLEIGGGRTSSAPGTARAGAALERILAYCGMLAGTPEPTPNQVEIDKVQIVRPHHGGMLISHITLADLGSPLPAAMEVATIVSPQTLESLEKLVTPFDPSYVILAREGFSPVSAGDFGFIFGHAAAAAAKES